MAEVWLARRDDGAFERQVAIKLLFRHAAGTERAALAQRFARERDILASLHHPNIAALHDAGVTPEGQPWLALEYVEGEPIIRWCDRQRLDIAGRVRLFCQVLLAVQHAHSNLAIHRDLKPANILVTAQGEVRLLDFGIAKLREPEGGALEDTELTRQGGRPLTLQYASPEQILGKPLTTACDVHALGVILYELLCGERPYLPSSASAAAHEHEILESDPKEPSRRVVTAAAAAARRATPRTIVRLLGGDLDAIVLKALARPLEERYASAEAMRADLERWSDGQPVDARMPTVGYRLRKFIARHRLAVGEGLAAGLVLLATTIAAVSFGIAAREESRRALAARDFLVEMFRESTPDQANGGTVTARELLSAGRLRATAVLRSQPLLRSELLAAIGEAQGYLGDSVQARASLADAATGFESVGAVREAVLARIGEADQALSAGAYADAAALLRRIQPLVAGRSTDRFMRARYDATLGKVEWKLGRLDPAAEHLAAAIDGLSEGWGPGDARTVEIISSLASVETERHHPAHALALVDDATQRQRASGGRSHTAGFALERNRAELLESAGRYRELVDQLADTIRRCDAAIGPGHDVCVRFRTRRALALVTMGRFADALPDVPDLLEAARAQSVPRRAADGLIAASRVLTANARLDGRDDLITGLQALGRSDREPAFEGPLKLFALMVPIENELRHHEGERVLHDLEQVAARRQQLEDAREDRLSLGRQWLMEGVAFADVGRDAEALDALGKARSAYAAVYGEGHPFVCAVEANDVRPLLHLGRAADASALLDRITPVLTGAFGEDAPAVHAVAGLRDGARDPKAPAMSAQGRWIFM
jgi:serine/threonine-protein kinase